MELRQLEYYVAVVQHGSILQAASALNLSQPPLSVAMKQLEQELGTPLFFRGARRPANAFISGPWTFSA